MFYIINFLLLSANLYFAILNGNWYSWVAVGFIAGMTAAMAIVQAMD